MYRPPCNCEPGVSERAGETPGFPPVLLAMAGVTDGEGGIFDEVVASGLPQFPQKRTPSRFSALQNEHIIALEPTFSTYLYVSIVLMINLHCLLSGRQIERRKNPC